MPGKPVTHSFGEYEIRGVWDADRGTWLLSATDIIAALGISHQPRRYWSDLKRNGILDENIVRSIVQLKLPSADGRMRETDAVPADDMAHILGSVHSAAAEQLSSWAAALTSPDVDWNAAPAPKAKTMMPLTNASFEPGSALAAAQAIPDPDSRAIALAEYHYYRGEAQAASDLSEPYLETSDPALRLSACWLNGYANLTLNRADRTYKASFFASKVLSSHVSPAVDPQLAAENVLAATGTAVLLHLPVPDGIPALGSVMGALPEGLRLLAAYINAHKMYLDGDWSASAGLAEGALSFSSAPHPIPELYLHLVCVMDHISLRQADLAREHLLTAWAIAQQDGFIQPFAEHHGLLGGMLEQCLKREWPDDFRRIIDITYRFSYGWRRIHNPNSNHKVADTLSTTQFTCAMLASRGWTNKEIAEHLGVTTNTVKACLSEAYGKLGIVRRSQLAQFMLK